MTLTGNSDRTARQNPGRLKTTVQGLRSVPPLFETQHSHDKD